MVEPKPRSFLAGLLRRALGQRRKTVNAKPGVIKYGRASEYRCVHPIFWEKQKSTSAQCFPCSRLPTRRSSEPLFSRPRLRTAEPGPSLKRAAIDHSPVPALPPDLCEALAWA
jgi:hypothetical protein